MQQPMQQMQQRRMPQRTSTAPSPPQRPQMPQRQMSNSMMPQPYSSNPSSAGYGTMPPQAYGAGGGLPPQQKPMLPSPAPRSNAFQPTTQQLFQMPPGPPADDDFMQEIDMMLGGSPTPPSPSMHNRGYSSAATQVFMT